jgi:uncharacterized protein
VEARSNLSIKLGIIGDTHGRIHPGLATLFSGVHQIVHAGDIGGMKVLKSLQEIAPVVAVRGNYDLEPELQPSLLPDPSSLTLAGLPVFLTHRLFTMSWDDNKELYARMLSRLEPCPRLVIFGHTHFPVNEDILGIVFVNPGYAGPDPLEGRPTAARLEIDADRIRVDILPLD